MQLLNQKVGHDMPLTEAEWAAWRQWVVKLPSPSSSAGTKRKRKKRRKKKAPKTSSSHSSHSRARRRQRQWHARSAGHQLPRRVLLRQGGRCLRCAGRAGFSGAGGGRDRRLPLLQLVENFAGFQHPCRGAEADPHGPFQQTTEIPQLQSTDKVLFDVLLQLCRFLRCRSWSQSRSHACCIEQASLSKMNVTFAVRHSSKTGVWAQTVPNCRAYRCHRRSPSSRWTFLWQQRQKRTVLTVLVTGDSTDAVPGQGVLALRCATTGAAVPQLQSSTVVDTPVFAQWHMDDPRFLSLTNQMNHCTLRFYQFTRCARELGEEETRCKYQYYRAQCACTESQLEDWMEHRAR